jgi:hypothetical protein
VAARGTPRDPALPSANVRQPITLNGSGFDLRTDIIFPTQSSSSDEPATRVVNPSQVSADGTSLQVVVPDDAKTGPLRIVGAEGAFTLQVVPTIVQVISPSTFATGQSLSIHGSAFTEDDTVITLGPTKLLDTGPFIGVDAFNVVGIGAGADRADNDGLSLLIPPGAGAGPFIVRTSGGEATLVAVSGVEGAALSGTPAVAGAPSANAGQTIRILGSGLTLAMEVIFPVVESGAGAVTNRIVRPDLVNTAGTLAEVRVPEDAITGPVQVVGAGGAFQLQVVPTLALVQRFAAGR